MKKLRWSRIILILILLLVVLFGGYYVYKNYLSSTSDSGIGQDGPALTLPKVPPTPDNMTAEQKQAAIDQARKDAIEAALASGQTQQQADKFGDLAAIAAKNAMNRPSSIYEK